MIKSVKFFSFSLLLVFLSTYSPKYPNENKSFLFPIKNIKIENFKIVNHNVLINELENLKGKSLMFLNNQSIKSHVTKFDFVSSYSIKKIYPSTLKILIVEKKPIAIHISGKKKFYISEKGHAIKFIELPDFDQLPLIFGKNINFGVFYKELLKVKFPVNQIKTYQHFDIGRWDIIFKSGKIIKLPKKSYTLAIENFVLLYKKKNFKKYKIFDYRINDQLILK
tara:strand:+ start:363 stop:1031 length:669 start_codon:yes stop_codon:yes gene_type:complete